MKTALVLAVVLPFAVACHDASQRPEPNGPADQEPGTSSDETPGTTSTTSAPGSDTPNANPSADSSSHADLVLLSPGEGDRVVGNPVTITGRARTFENNVVIEARDANGDLITTAWTTANGEMGNLNPFSTTVWLTRDPGERLTIALVDHSAKDGSLRAMTRRTVDFTGDTLTETLMFPLKNPGNDCSVVRAVQREIPAAKGRLRALVEALVNGPTEVEADRHGVASQFPRGTKIRGVDIDGSKAIIDFGPEMSNVGGSCRALALRASIEETVTRIPGISTVEIRAMGEAGTALQP